VITAPGQADSGEQDSGRNEQQAAQCRHDVVVCQSVDDGGAGGRQRDDRTETVPTVVFADPTP
jgi:hypothetical protein